MDKWIVISTSVTDDTPMYYSGDINTYEDSWNESDLMASLFPTEIKAVIIAIASPVSNIIDIKKVTVNV